MIVTVIVTNNRRQRAEQLIGERGWRSLRVEEVFDMPSIFIGAVDDIVEAMEERRERYGFSYNMCSSGSPFGWQLRARRELGVTLRATEAHDALHLNVPQCAMRGETPRNSADIR